MYKERFINYLKFEKRYSEHTIIAYEREIQGLFDFISAESVPFEEIDYRFLRYYFSNLKEQGKEASSVNRAISSLKSFYKFLMREGLVKQNPCINKITEDCQETTCCS
jgi:integrase/recombinase XerC